MENKKKIVGFALDEVTLRRLDAMKAVDRRDRSAEFSALVEQEFKRRMNEFPTLTEVERINRVSLEPVVYDEMVERMIDNTGAIK